MKGETEKKKIRRPSTRERERFWDEVFVEEIFSRTRLGASIRTMKLLKDFAQRIPKNARRKLISKDFVIIEVHNGARVDNIVGPLQLMLLNHHFLNELSEKEVIGVLAHEFAHIALNHPMLSEEAERIEKEADELASKWGFAEEIKLLRVKRPI